MRITGFATDKPSLFFEVLSEHFIANKKQRTVIVFDGFQWMAAAGLGKLVSLLKYYWDNVWKDQNVLVILGGVPRYLEFLNQSKSFEQNIASPWCEITCRIGFLCIVVSIN